MHINEAHRWWLWNELVAPRSHLRSADTAGYRRGLLEYTIHVCFKAVHSEAAPYGIFATQAPSNRRYSHGSRHQDLVKNQWQMLYQNLHLNLFLKGKLHCQVPCSNKSATVSAYFKWLC